VDDPVKFTADLNSARMPWNIFDGKIEKIVAANIFAIA